MKMVKMANQAGADAIKLQTYTADTMTFNIDSDEFRVIDQSSPWNGKHMYDLYNEASTPWEWHEEIFNYAKKLILLAFSSQFDDSAVDFLEGLDVPAYKIASFECIDTQLIKKAASTGKPLIISTGMATKEEIFEAINAAREVNCRDLAILKCTSNYPASPSNTNISSIRAMRDIFNCEVGISDHTLGIGVSCAAISFGATIIEKHLTLDRSVEGIDADFSMEPDEFKMMIEEIHKAWESQGDIIFGGTEAEKKSRQRRRSLYFSKNINSGTILSSEHIKRVRPGNGLKPKYFDMLIGKKLKKSVKMGEPISWEVFY